MRDEAKKTNALKMLRLFSIYTHASFLSGCFGACLLAGAPSLASGIARTGAPQRTAMVKGMSSGKLSKSSPKHGTTTAAWRQLGWTMKVSDVRRDTM